MVGFPFADGIRCKLLLGLDVIAASFSKPIVPLTKSRRIRRAVAGSPLRNSEIASSRSAIANSGSWRSRCSIVSVAFLAKAIYFLLFRKL